jgi:polyribonucleotide 5'-hydroxyl-kinase
MAIERPADVEEGFSQLCPLIYHFGYKEPGSNPILHDLLVAKLAQTVAEKMEANRISNAMLLGLFTNSILYQLVYV